MPDLGQNFIGHKELPLDYKSSVTNMSAIMDMYLNASDSMSFQDMLDIDIKSEIESLAGDHNDFSSLNFSDLPPLELGDVSDIKWFSSSNSNHSNSSLNFDFNSEDGSAMVNPNVVMPVISLAQSIRSPSPTMKESHLTFSPSALKISTIKQQETSSNNSNNVKRDLINRLDGTIERKQTIKTIKVTPILSKPIVKTFTKAPTLLTFRNSTHHHHHNHRQMSSPLTVNSSNNITVRSVGTTNNTIRKFSSNSSNNNNNNNNSNSSSNKFYNDGERIYPKPAYSYSCLIAMALKNSRTGSLPVSEIYNFMCKHFPYFKTAPNGWKNSVRHNLSLNKCFEKIEKPALNGAQRKGCLWAMNPAKISKMDEEVQKWSRKDPSAIRKAMINPEHLELLERGELKFTCSYDEGDHFGGDSCGSAESEEGSDYEQETDVKITTTKYGYLKNEHEIKMEFEYHDVSIVKQESDDDNNSDLDVEANNDFDIEVTEDCGGGGGGGGNGGKYEDLEDDQEMLRMEVALAQKELFDYEKPVSNKKRRTYIIQN